MGVCTCITVNLKWDNIAFFNKQYAAAATHITGWLIPKKNP